MTRDALVLAVRACFFGMLGAWVYLGLREIVSSWFAGLYGRVIRVHRPFMWHWGQDEDDRRWGLRHWGFWFTEPGR